MSKNGVFIPKPLKDSEGLEGFVGMSGNYFKVAQELRERCKTDIKGMPGHYYVFPSVIMYVSSLEAFFSEYLAIVHFLNKGNDKIIEKLVKLKDEYHFDERLKGIFDFFNNSKEKLEFRNVWYQNVNALKALRNSAAHYNPDFISHIFWPEELEKALNRSKVDVINSDWASNFSRPAISDWVYGTIKDVIFKFSEISGSENPFNRAYPFGWEVTNPDRE